MTVDRDTLMGLIKRHGLDTLDGAFAYAGGGDLVKAGLGTRRRTQVDLQCDDGRKVRVYLKRYGREPLAARLRRLFTYGPWKSPGCVEYRNIDLTRRAGVPTMEALACGQRCGILGCVRSYVIVTEVPGDAIERCMEDFLAAASQGEVTEFTLQLGRLTRVFHFAGLVHRDYYASHIFMHRCDGKTELYLIDLARVFRPRWRKFRWRVKDLAQLKYSMPARWVDEYWETFMVGYLGAACGQRLQCDRAVDAKVVRMRRRADRKAARCE